MEVSLQRQQCMKYNLKQQLHVVTEEDEVGAYVSITDAVNTVIIIKNTANSNDSFRQLTCDFIQYELYLYSSCQCDKLIQAGSSSLNVTRFCVHQDSTKNRQIVEYKYCLSSNVRMYPYSTALVNYLVMIVQCS